MPGYSREQLMQALRNADKAGDTKAATAIARAIQAMPQPKPKQQPADNRPTSLWRGIGEGIMAPLNNAAEALEYGASKIGLDRPINSIGEALGMAPSAKAAIANQRAASARASTQGSGIGEFVGNVIGTLPTLALPGGPIVQGMAGGALLTKKRDLKGIAQDAAIGGVAGKLGQVTGKVAGRVISPKVAPVVQRMQQRGIPMTMGQIAGANGGVVGKAVKAAEDKATSLPVLGDAINAARRRGVEAFNRAAINETLAPIGASLPKGLNGGHGAVAFAERQLGQAYDTVLPKMSAKADAQFAEELTNLAGQAETMLPARAQQFGAVMQADVVRFFGPDGTITGKGLKEVETRLGARIRNYMGSADPDARDMAIALRDAQSVVRDLAARQNPLHAADLAKINQGWALFTRVQRAAAQGLEGNFTPGQLRTATRVSDKSVRKGASARGEAMMQSFAEDAQGVLPSSIPDSGTAGRLFTGLVVGEAAGGMAGLPGATTASLVGGAIPYTKAGQKAAEWLLTGRQGPSSRAVAKALSKFVPFTAAPAVAATGAEQQPPNPLANVGP